jgi:hypothetical protein
MMDKLELAELAEHYEDKAMFYARHLFNINGVPTGYASDPDSHREEVAYVANCFTIAAALRARAEGGRA